jgi:hypothetical protein
MVLGSRPSINGFDNGDGILTMNSVGSVMGFSFDVEINPALDIGTCFAHLSS